MKAIVQRGYGAPERVLKLEDVDRPSVGDDDVLVRVWATSVNTPDWITVTGTPYVLRLQSGLRKPRTLVRGTDIAGVVEADRSAMGRTSQDISVSSPARPPRDPITPLTLGVSTRSRGR